MYIFYFFVVELHEPGSETPFEDVVDREAPRGPLPYAADDGPPLRGGRHHLHLLRAVRVAEATAAP